MKMRKKLQRFGEVGIVYETSAFGLGFFEKTEWILAHLSRHRISTQKKDGFENFI